MAYSTHDRRTSQPFVGNMDPSNEFMYQLPIGADGQRMKPPGEAVIDLALLNQRLHGLGLPAQQPLPPPSPSSSSTLSSSSPPLTNRHNHPNYPYAREDFPPAPTETHNTITEIMPDDSVSVHRPPHGATPARGYRQRAASRRGGTDVDPGELNVQIDHEHGGNHSTWELDTLSRNSPTDMRWAEPIPAQSQWTAGTTGGNMYAMREKLLRHAEAQEAAHQAEHHAQLNETAQLAAALAKLESTEEQLRTLQATLIAEKVVRSQVERNSQESTQDMKDCRDELAGAVRALRRARDEGKKTDEERRSLQKSFETVRAKLYRYEQELSNRDAHARGRERGRQEAWEEAAKWMGMSPPIPIDPIQHIPETVLRQGHTNDLQQQPHDQYQYGQPQQPSSGQSGGRQQYFQTPPLQSQGPSPPLADQNGQYQQMPSDGSHPGHPQHMPTPDFPGQHGTMRLQRTGEPLQAQHTGGHMQPQHTAQSHHGQQAQQAPAPQMIGMPAPVPMGQPMAHGQQPMQQAHELQPPYGGQSRSVPHRPAQLPPQQQPMRAATVVGRPSRHEQPAHAHTNGHAPTTGQTHHQPLDSVPRPHAADSYLDRVETDPRLKMLLSGAPTKTINTSQFPPSEYGDVAVDKPLPNPFLDSSGQGRTTRRSTMAGTTATGHAKSRRRQSLSDGVLPAHPNLDQIPDGDRYPAFPGGAQGQNGMLGQSMGLGMPQAGGHRRNTSYGSVDPAAYALPPSTMHSAYTTPQTHHQHPGSTRQSTRQTPQSQPDRARSRMAGALRTGTDMDPGELSQIEEEHEHRPSRHEGGRQNERDLMQSTIMQNMAEKPRSKAGTAPPMRWQPRLPVMPTPLGANRAMSDAGHPSGPRPSAAQMAQMRAAQMSTPSQNVGPRGDDPPRTNPYFIPPGMAPLAVSGDVEDVQGPRHSALGLEGLESRSGSAKNALGHRQHHEEGHGHQHSNSQSQGHGGFLGLFGKGEGSRAPTITIQPPSSRSKSANQISQVASNKTETTPLPPTADQHHDQPSKRQTTIITEYYDDPLPTRSKDVEPHDIPLPLTRAPTVMSHRPPMPAVIPILQPHEVPLPKSRAPTAAPTSVPAHTVPLPKAKSQAPTQYTAQSPRSDMLSPERRDRHAHHQVQSHRRGHEHEQPRPRTDRTERTMPNISVIDYALAFPLPESRPTTFAGTPKDINRSQLPAMHDSQERPKSAAGAKSKRKPTLSAYGDPTKVPLPASRAPSHRPRASTYARTEGTIDEVTEEESGRENRAGKRRW